MRTITLTNDQAIRLEMFLLMTESYRKREVDACERLSKEIKEDGTPQYPAMASNASWWKETDISMGEIKKIIQDAP